MEDLPSLAAMFRVPSPELVPRAERDAVVSRLTVWVLELSLDFFPSEYLRNQALQIRDVHRSRALGQAPDRDLWETLKAGGEFGGRLWMVDWLPTRQLPGHSPIVQAMVTAALGLARAMQADFDGPEQVKRQELILRMVREIDGQRAEGRTYHEQMRRLVGHRLQYECLLSHKARSEDEAALKAEARLGSPGPYLDWLVEGNDDAQHIVGKWLPFV